MSTTQPIRNKNELQEFKDYFWYVKPSKRNYLLIIMGLNSALRISDILHLKYGDVFDFHKKAWKTHITVKEQKTGKENSVYINKEIRNTLELCVDCTMNSQNNWLFASQKQKLQPLSRYQAYRLIREAAASAGIEGNISCHSLRKTFGYHAWKQGISPALLTNIYNHSSYQVTKRYLGIDQEDKDKVFEDIQL